jgi:hypothetical protein
MTRSLVASFKIFKIRLTKQMLEPQTFVTQRKEMTNDVIRFRIEAW